jgi:hypothetical protein
MWVGGKAHPDIYQQYGLAERLKQNWGISKAQRLEFDELHLKPNLRENVKLV